MDGQKISELNILVKVLVTAFQEELLKLEENKREVAWKKLIEDFKNENPLMFVFIQMGVLANFEATPKQKIKKAIKIYNGEKSDGKPDKEVDDMLACIIATELLGLKVSDKLTIDIKPATAARVLSL